VKGPIGKENHHYRFNCWFFGNERGFVVPTIARRKVVQNEKKGFGKRSIQKQSGPKIAARNI